MGEKLNSIIDGWKNLIWSSEGIKKMAMARAKICSGCENNVLGVCTKCRCVLAAKTRAILEKCDMSKW